MRRADGPRWNQNIHFHRLVLDAIPSEAVSALDVGTGNGLLAVELREILDEVTAVDIDSEVLAAASKQDGRIEWLQADVMTHDFERTFDAVASIATLHHFANLRDALTRLAGLTAPGGVLVIVGLARATTVSDHVRGVTGIAQHQWFSRTRNFWEHSAPTVWPPPHSYTQVREAAEEVLPGVQWRHFAMWRYALIWNRPA